MILTVEMERMFKAATLLSVLMQVYMIPRHDRGYINVTLVLQSCTDPLQVLPGSSIETFPTASDGTYGVSNTTVEEDVVVMEKGFTPINKELDIVIKKEEILEDIVFLDIKTEPNEVSYVCTCLLSDTFNRVQKYKFFCDANISCQLIQLHVWERKYILFSM
jgi:hypothetical protein